MFQLEFELFAIFVNDFDCRLDGDQMKLGCFVLLGVVHFCEVGVHFSVSGNFSKALNRRRLRCFIFTFALFIIMRFIVCCLPAPQTQQSLRTAGNSGLFRIVALRVEGIFFPERSLGENKNGGNGQAGGPGYNNYDQKVRCWSCKIFCPTFFSSICSFGE